MNDVLEMLQQLMEKLGMTAEQAWPMVVAHVKTSALMNIVAFSIGLVASTIVACVINKPMKNRLRKVQLPNATIDDDSALMGLVLALFISACCVVGFSFGIVEEIPDYVNPEGATIRLLIGK